MEFFPSSKIAKIISHWHFCLEKKVGSEIIILRKFIQISTTTYFFDAPEEVEKIDLLAKLVFQFELLDYRKQQPWKCMRITYLCNVAGNCLFAKVLHSGM